MSGDSVEMPEHQISRTPDNQDTEQLEQRMAKPSVTRIRVDRTEVRLRGSVVWRLGELDSEWNYCFSRRLLIDRADGSLVLGGP